MSRSTAIAVVVVEVPAEALLVAVAGDAHDERVGELAVGEERQAGRLAAQLVLGVVQVGEVLDLRDRHQPGQAGAERQAEDRLLVEQCVEHPPAAGPALQTAGDAVHAALGADVLAEDEHGGVGGEQVAERPVDRLGQRERTPVLRQAAEEPPAIARCRRRRPPVRRQRPAGAATAAPSPRRPSSSGAVRTAPPAAARTAARPCEVAVDDRRSSRAAVLDEHRAPSPATGLDRGRRACRRRRGRPDSTSVPAWPPKRTVRRCSTAGLPARAHPVGEVLGDVEHAHRVGAVGHLVAQVRAPRQRGRHPAGGRRHADPPPVVLADEQHGHRHALVRGVGARR